MDTLTIRGVLLNGVFDSPARCLFHNMVQFNGFYGCPYCYTPGKTVQTSERGHTLSYPFNVNNQNGYGENRTHNSFTNNGVEAEQNKSRGTSNSTVKGVKGLTWFNFLPNFDVVRGVSIDYMHCVLLGVVKMLMTLWFDKSHRNEIFSISAKLAEVDKRLLGIRPPNFIARLPRSLSDMSHFKAAELKNFLLFYSLPCLYGILPEDQYNHFSLLVYSVYILLQQKITPDDILKCNRMLLEFVLNLPVLYAERYSTSNVHLLLHLTEKVKLLGPLWCSSCFYFEDFNGQLRRLFHGTQKIESQIAFAVCIHQRLPKMSESLTYGSSEREFYHKMMDKKRKATQENICERIFVVGAYHSRQLTEEEQHSIFLAVGTYQSVSLFRRLYVDCQTVHCVEYRNAVRRDNSIITFNESSFGQVQIFVKVNSTNNLKPIFLALIKEMKNEDSGRGSTKNHMIRLKTQYGQLRAIGVDQITDVCVFVKVNEELGFVSAVPNKVEKE